MMDLKTFKDWLLSRPSIPPEELRRFTEAARRPPSASVKERTLRPPAGEGAGRADGRGCSNRAGRNVGGCVRVATKRR